LPTRLLHLSDIHFRGYGNGWDDDADYRGELLRDVERLVGENRIDGILVGGDIAWSGQPQEFADAREWLEQLTDVCRCPLAQVWMVPGNHDVEWARADGDISTHFRDSVRACEDNNLDAHLRHRFVEDPLGHVLIEPLMNYNAFASDWGCRTTAAEPGWTDTVLEVDGRALQLCGLNSALASDRDDSKADARRRLVLGTRQCKIARSPNTVHVVLCHHPPDWLRDWERVAPYLRRAHLVLFGHEHTYDTACVAPKRTVHVFAGAVGPEPGDDCVPTFNLITLAADSDELQVTIEPRIWDREGTRFQAHGDGPSQFAVALDLDEQADDARAEVDVTTRDAETPGAASPAIDLGAEGAREPRTATPLVDPGQPATATDGASPTALDLRDLGFRYLTSARSNRLRIAVDLGVVDPVEINSAVDPDDLFIEILRRVRERDLVGQLAKELGDDE
jgi:predicted MPP superfamily phosphohydrolase